jgi:hypothetical protein
MRLGGRVNNANEARADESVQRFGCPFKYLSPAHRAGHASHAWTALPPHSVFGVPLLPEPKAI